MENHPISSEASTEISRQDRSTGMWMHAGPFLAHLVNFMFPIPFLSLIAALVLYYTNREREGFVRENGKESLNFQITLALIWTVFIIIAGILMGSFFLNLFMSGFRGEEMDMGSGLSLAFGALPLMGVGFVIWLFSTIVMILGSVRANDGKVYRYPVSIRFVK